MSVSASRSPVDPWNVPETDFPALGSLSEKLRFLLNYAVLAPSGHNTQPWLFRVLEDAVEVYADRSRGLAVVDPDDRELVISCGSALVFLRIAMHALGLREHVVLLPDPTHHDLLAHVSVTGAHEPTPLERQLFHAIPKRRTNRTRFHDRKLPATFQAELQGVAVTEGTWLEIVDGEHDRNRVADLIVEGDRIQMANKSFRRELAAWTASNRSDRRDGIPGYGFGMSDLISLAGPFVIRTFDLGGFQAAKDRDLAHGSPLLVVLGTEDDTPRHWLAAGQALGRILLRARADDVWASFLNQPIEVESLRPKLLELLDRAGYPQLLLRMGYGQTVKPTPRRAVEDVVIS
jgi:hypothetical protein